MDRVGNQKITQSLLYLDAFYPEDGKDAATLLRSADAAMYLDKDDAKLRRSSLL